MVVKIIGGPSVKSVWFGGSLKANNSPSCCQDGWGIFDPESLKARNGHCGCQNGLRSQKVFDWGSF